MAEGDIKLNVRAAADGLGVLDDTKEKLSKLGETVGSLAGGSLESLKSAALGILGPVGALGAAAIAAGEQLETATIAIERMTGASGAAAEQMLSSFTNAFPNVTQGADEFARALSLLSIRTGESGSALEALAQTEAHLAQVTGSDLGATVDTTTKLFANWSIETRKQGETLDFLLHASQASGVSVGQLATSVTEAGAMFRNFGFSLDQSVALLGKLAVHGIDASTAMTGLRFAFVQLENAGVKDLGPALQEIFDDIRNAKNPTDAASIALEFFGTRVGPRLVGPIRDGTLAVGDFVAKIKQMPGSVDEAAQKTETLGEALTKLAHTTTSGPLGQIGASILSFATDAVNDLDLVSQALFADSVEWADDATKIDQSTGKAADATRKLADATAQFPAIFQAAGDGAHTFLTNLEAIPASADNSKVKLLQFNDQLAKLFPNDKRIVTAVVTAEADPAKLSESIDKAIALADELLKGKEHDLVVRALLDQKSAIQAKKELDQIIPSTKDVNIVTHYSTEGAPDPVTDPLGARLHAQIMADVARMRTPRQEVFSDVPPVSGFAPGSVVDLGSGTTGGTSFGGGSALDVLDAMAAGQLALGALQEPIPAPVLEPQIIMSPPVPFATGIDNMTAMVNDFATNAPPLVFPVQYAANARLDLLSPRGLPQLAGSFDPALSILESPESATVGQINQQIADLKVTQARLDYQSNLFPGYAEGIPGVGGNSQSTAFESRQITSMINQLQLILNAMLLQQQAAQRTAVASERTAAATERGASASERAGAVSGGGIFFTPTRQIESDTRRATGDRNFTVS